MFQGDPEHHVSRDDDEAVENALVTTATDVATGGAFGVLSTLAGHFGLTPAFARTPRIVHEARLGHLEDRVAELWAAHEAAKERGQDVDPADVGAMAESLARGMRRTADPKKRRLLRAAARNAFDPALYEEGVVLELMDMLETLTYADVAIVRFVGLAPERSMEDVRRHFPAPGIPVAHPARARCLRLIDRGLLFTQQDTDAHAWRGFDGGSVGATELGRQLGLLLRGDEEPDQD